MHNGRLMHGIKTICSCSLWWPWLWCKVTVAVRWTTFLNLLTFGLFFKAYLSHKTNNHEIIREVGFRQPWTLHYISPCIMYATGAWFSGEGLHDCWNTLKTFIYDHKYWCFYCNRDRRTVEAYHLCCGAWNDQDVLKLKALFDTEIRRMSAERDTWFFRCRKWHQLTYFGGNVRNLQWHCKCNVLLKQRSVPVDHPDMTFAVDWALKTSYLSVPAWKTKTISSGQTWHIYYLMLW